MGRRNAPTWWCSTERGAPLLVAECKAAEVEIDQAVLAQAVRYNSVLGARYILLTNGLRHYCYEATEEGYRVLQEIPAL